AAHHPDARRRRPPRPLRPQAPLRRRRPLLRPLLLAAPDRDPGAARRHPRVPGSPTAQPRHGAPAAPEVVGPLVVL
ncbi:MAG: hypothetical protein AVDCRST_MAG40-2728, partial [uncultured Gemmatimonadaceae bacterium]